jgi:hypothetical protein
VLCGVVCVGVSAYCLVFRGECLLCAVMCVGGVRAVWCDVFRDESVFFGVMCVGVSAYCMGVRLSECCMVY